MSSPSSTATSTSSKETTITTTVPYIETPLPTLQDDIATSTSASITLPPGTVTPDGENQTTTAALDMALDKGEENAEPYTIIVPTVIAGLAILITAVVFIAIWRRRLQTKSNGTKTAIGQKTSASDVMFENTKIENEEDALKHVSYGLHYMHLHVYSNTVNDEYSMLESAQSVKSPDQTEVADKDAYSEISINNAEYYNQK